MEIIYKTVVEGHLKEDEEMIFLSGARGVGKTRLAKGAKGLTSDLQYFNLDKMADRERVIKNTDGIFKSMDLETAVEKMPIVVFDEVDKYKKWKSLIKRFYDDYKGRVKIVVIGRADLEVYKASEDGLKRKYFLYRMHPLSVGEVGHKKATSDYFLRESSHVRHGVIEDLLDFGGFPEPFLKKSKRYYGKWQVNRRERLIKEDVQGLARVEDLNQIELLHQLLKEQAGELLCYNELSKELNVSSPTTKKWIGILEGLYYCFMVKPWHRDVKRSITKEPKVYLCDWSLVKKGEQRVKNFVASHLLKAVHFWVDRGLGAFDLFFLRDKDKRGVDFLITKGHKPWLLVEVKMSKYEGLSSCLRYFQRQTKAPYAVQLVYNMRYEKIDFKEFKEAKIVPMGAFLSLLP